MESPSKDFKKSIRFALIIAMSLYPLVGVSAYLLHGENSNELLTENFPQNNSFFVVLRLCISFAALVSFPLQLFAAVNMFERMFDRSFLYVR
jgi:amino acid permease